MPLIPSWPNLDRTLTLRAVAADVIIATRADAVDPDYLPGGFSQRLHSMGIARPTPTFSPSSQVVPQPSQGAVTSPLYPSASKNATLSVLEARRLLEQQAARDSASLARHDFPGRRFLDMRATLDAMVMRDRKIPDPDIERRLGFEPGVLDKLGPPRILTHLSAK